MDEARTVEQHVHASGFRHGPADIVRIEHVEPPRRDPVAEVAKCNLIDIGRHNACACGSKCQRRGAADSLRRRRDQNRPTLDPVCHSVSVLARSGGLVPAFDDVDVIRSQYHAAMLVDDLGARRRPAHFRALRIVLLAGDRYAHADRVADIDRLHEAQPIVAVGEDHRVYDAGGQSNCSLTSMAA